MSYRQLGFETSYRGAGVFAKLTAMLQSLIRSQTYLSRRFDMCLPARFTIDGNQDYLRMTPSRINAGTTIWDLGGGKHPLIDPAVKGDKRLRVVGLDISAEELTVAPAGAYDEIVVADISKFRGRGDADLVFCQALLEHVRDTAAAFEGISSILKPGGTAIVFTPSRNAAFARLNLLMHQRLKERLLFAIYPDARGQQGFPAYYDRCTPREFRRMAEAAGLRVTDVHLYYQSNYFNFAFPIHLVWRFWVLLFALVAPDSAAETFTMTFKKN